MDGGLDDMAGKQTDLTNDDDLITSILVRSLSLPTFMQSVLLSAVRESIVFFVL